MTPEQILSWVQGILLLALVLQAAVTDLWKRKIYNWPTVGGIIAGLALGYGRGGLGEFSLAAAEPGVVTLASALGGMLLFFTLFLLAYLVGGMGAGDVKLVAAVGALSGLNFSIWAIFHIAFAGAVLALLWLAFKKELRGGLRRSLLTGARLRWRQTDTEKLGKPVTVPYGVAICAGVLLALWYLYGMQPLPFFLLPQQSI